MTNARYFVSQLVPPFLWSLARSLYRRTSRPADARIEAELARLVRLQPHCGGHTKIFRRRFEFIDARSFVNQYKRFFIRKTYGFNSRTESPRIIDCGANIGVSVLWWKSIYPKAEIIAFEADPAIFEVLKRNCAGLDGVTLYNKAVWVCHDKMPFASIGGEGGRLVERDERKDGKSVCTVDTIRLRDYLEKGCDFLKVDIEGAEVDVINDCKDVLRRARLMSWEYHSFFFKRQSLASFIGHLESAGFRVHAHVGLPSPSPFVELLNLNEKDLRIDLFCFKDGEYPTLKSLN